MGPKENRDVIEGFLQERRETERKAVVGGDRVPVQEKGENRRRRASAK